MEEYFKLKVINGDMSKKHHQRYLMDNGILYDFKNGLYKKMLEYSKKYPKTLFIFKTVHFDKEKVSSCKTVFVNGNMDSKTKLKDLY